MKKNNLMGLIIIMIIYVMISSLIGAIFNVMNNVVVSWFFLLSFAIMIAGFQVKAGNKGWIIIFFIIALVWISYVVYSGYYVNFQVPSGTQNLNQSGIQIIPPK